MQVSNADALVMPQDPPGGTMPEVGRTAYFLGLVVFTCTLSQRASGTPVSQIPAHRIAAFNNKEREAGRILTLKATR